MEVGYSPCLFSLPSSFLFVWQVSIAGKVTAISPLKWTNNRPQFLLQLSLTYNRKTVSVRITMRLPSADAFSSCTES